MRERKDWNVSVSIIADKTFNPIRDIIENLQMNPNPDKPMIALSIGDPTVFGNLAPAPQCIDAIVRSIQSGKFNGYAQSTGQLEARAAVAKYICDTSRNPLHLEAKDIILCSGCSSCLDLCITCLASPGQNILMPRPGFPLYKTLANGLGVQTKEYDLLPDKNWEVDIGHLEELIDEETVAIVINNPSNPCGSVFSKTHLLELLDVARRNRVPIIADEIYENFVFLGQEYHPIASLSTDVPVLSCGGLTKMFLVPGWRMGWIAICDRNNIFDKEIRKGLHCLSQRVIGSNTIVQGGLSDILQDTPQEFFEDTISQVQVGVQMVCFPEFSSDLQLVEALISEESVFCLPGKCFNYPNYFRIVLTVPRAQMQEACARITLFCNRRFVSSPIFNGINGSSEKSILTRPEFKIKMLQIEDHLPLCQAVPNNK